MLDVDAAAGNQQLYMRAGRLARSDVWVIIYEIYRIHCKKVLDYIMLIVSY